MGKKKTAGEESLQDQPQEQFEEEGGRVTALDSRAADHGGSAEERGNRATRGALLLAGSVECVQSGGRRPGVSGRRFPCCLCVFHQRQVEIPGQGFCFRVGSFGCGLALRLCVDPCRSVPAHSPRLVPGAYHGAHLLRFLVVFLHVFEIEQSVMACGFFPCTFL